MFLQFLFAHFFLSLKKCIRFLGTQRQANSPEENRKKALYQLINKEQQYATGMQFAVTRFVSALAERRDLLTPHEHRVLFQNAEEVSALPANKPN